MQDQSPLHWLEQPGGKYGDPFATLLGIVEAQQRVFLPYQMLEARFGAHRDR